MYNLTEETAALSEAFKAKRCAAYREERETTPLPDFSGELIGPNADADAVESIWYVTNVLHVGSMSPWEWLNDFGESRVRFDTLRDLDLYLIQLAAKAGGICLERAWEIILAADPDPVMLGCMAPPYSGYDSHGSAVSAA